MTQYREILRLNSLGINKTKIAQSLNCSRNTVRSILKRAEEHGLRWPLPPELGEIQLQEKLLKKAGPKQKRKPPDVAYIHKELLRDGVNLKLLWHEYCGECRKEEALPLMYSQFCEHYRQYEQTKRATMRIPRKPGELIEVDWAGKHAQIIDRDRGEVIPAYLFVAALPYSQYAYVEAFLTMNQESWISAHANMYQYYGGATKILVPDNLKTGVVKPDLYDPQINRSYQELSEHYHTAIIPARVRSPKDKASVESTVGTVSTWIIGALRNEPFFTLAQLNKAIRRKLDTLNQRPFQKREGSRRSVFLAEEKPLLLSLPSTPYEMSTWQQATVPYHYHIQVDKMYYSVPYKYIRHKVDIRITHQVIEVFYKNHRVCSHPKLTGHPGQYATNKTHMPQNHQKYVEWDSDKIIERAKQIGGNTARIVQFILSSASIEKQAQRSCMALLKLKEKHSAEKLEVACTKAFSYTSHPSLKIVKSILVSADQTDQTKAKSRQQSKQAKGQQTETQVDLKYSYTRGADYYGRKTS